MPKISALPSASALAGTEETPLVQSGTTKKATPDQFKTFVLAGFSAFGLTLGGSADAAAARAALGLGSAATADTADFAAASHTHTSADISDFAEAVEDKIGAKVVAGTGVSIAYNDATGETTVTNTAPSAGSYTDENARDAVGAALTGEGGVIVTPNDGADTIRVGVKRIVQIAVTDPNGSAIATGDGQAYFRVPSTLNGMNLVEVAATVTTVSSSGTPTVQLARIRSGSAADMLSTRITIDASENDSSTAAAAAVIDTANDDVATADLIRVDLDVAGTGAKGLIVTLTFQLP